MIEALSPNHRQVVQELRKKKGNSGASGDKGDDSGWSGGVKKQMKDSINQVSLSLKVPSVETRSAF